MCIKIVEQYTNCRCPYYVHPVDPCSHYGRKGHEVSLRTLFVGYACSQHSKGGGGGPPLHHVAESSVDSGSLSNDYHASFEGKTTITQRINSAKLSLNIELVKTLRVQLRASMVLSDTRRYFLPSDALDHCLTPENLCAILDGPEWALLPDSTLLSCKKVIAILLMIQRLEILPAVLREGLKDEHLPLKMPDNSSSEQPRAHPAFLESTNDTQKLFLDSQWMVLAPTFSTKGHEVLSSAMVLPILSRDPISAGAYGRVYNVRLHPSHQNLSLNKDSCFALKQLAKDDHGAALESFHREFAMLNLRRPLHQDRIVPLLASFEQDDQYNLIFPLAWLNLRDFLADPAMSGMPEYAYLEQMTGITGALSCLHNDLKDIDSEPLTCMHLDLKPENILIFNEGSMYGTWKLADFGLSSIQIKDSKLTLPPHPGYGTYEPPECQLNQEQTPAYDMWSLGCIFLECIVSALEGHEAIEAFADARMKESRMGLYSIIDDYFFSLNIDTIDAPTAVTRRAVLEKIKQLGRIQKCSRNICTLLRIIEDSILRVDKNERMQSSILFQIMSSMTLHDQTTQTFDSPKPVGAP